MDNRWKIREEYGKKTGDHFLDNIASYGDWLEAEVLRLRKALKNAEHSNTLLRKNRK